MFNWFKSLIISPSNRKMFFEKKENPDIPKIESWKSEYISFTIFKSSNEKVYSRSREPKEFDLESPSKVLTGSERFESNYPQR